MNLKIIPGMTRIDLERLDADVVMRVWFGKWHEGDRAEYSDYLAGARIESLLMQCEKAGFTVHMIDGQHGRALRGEITRIDFMDGKIRKYPWGWSASTRPIQERDATADEQAAGLQWCKENGWTVREWPCGGRAWKGEEKPVRDGITIQRLRRVVDSTPGDPRKHYDLAFCW
jgi:hypothetical protein